MTSNDMFDEQFHKTNKLVDLTINFFIFNRRFISKNDLSFFKGM